MMRQRPRRWWRRGKPRPRDGKRCTTPIGTTSKPSRSRCIPSASRTRSPDLRPGRKPLQTAVEAIEVFAQRHQLPARPDAMTKVRKQVPPWLRWWTSGGKASTGLGAIPSYRLSGGSGCTQCFLPMVYWDHQVARTRCRRRKAKIREALEAVRAAFTRMPSPSGWPPKSLRIGTRGPPTGSRPFSGPHRPSKGATAICRKCITIIVACPSSATRCGPSCITSIVALRMGRRLLTVFGDPLNAGQLHDFKGLARRCVCVAEPEQLGKDCVTMSHGSNPPSGGRR